MKRMFIEIPVRYEIIDDLSTLPEQESKEDKAIGLLWEAHAALIHSQDPKVQTLIHKIRSFLAE